jgi:Kef-type K+ transport system membrane component KefB
MELPEGLGSLTVIVLIATLAPLIAGMVRRPRIPEVVLLLVLGIAVGPQALGLAETTSEIELIANLGLGFLFFLAGYELDLSVLRGSTGTASVGAWLAALTLAMAIVGALAAIGFVKAFLPVTIALTTTALGTLLPILRDSGELTTPFGRAILANGAVGEFLPIVAISVFLGAKGAWESIALLIGFGLLAFGLSRASRWLRVHPLSQVVQQGSETSSQTTVRVTVLLLVTLLYVSGEIGLDIVLGAFAAGIVLRVAMPGGDRPLEHKLEGLAFGFFIPVFFVASGMKMDVDSIVESPARLAVFFALMLLVRGLPVFVAFRSRLPGNEPVRLGLLSATALPLVVAITQIGLDSGHMLPENAAALVGAALLTVLVFPMLAGVLSNRRQVGSPSADVAPETR